MDLVDVTDVVCGTGLTGARRLFYCRFNAHHVGGHHYDAVDPLPDSLHVLHLSTFFLEIHTASIQGLRLPHLHMCPKMALDGKPASLVPLLIIPKQNCFVKSF